MMLCSMFRGGHFKHVGDAEQRFLSVSISYHLKNKKKLEINNKKKNKKQQSAMLANITIPEEL